MPDAMQDIASASGNGLICRVKCSKSVKSYPTIGVERAGCTGIDVRLCVSQPAGGRKGEYGG